MKVLRPALVPHLLLLLLLLPWGLLHASSRFEKFYIDSDFDTDTVGTPPFEWSSKLQASAGSLSAVTSDQAVTGDRSIELRTGGVRTDGATALWRLDLADHLPLNHNHFCSFRVRFTNNTNQQFRFYLSDAAKASIGNLVVVFQNGAVYAWSGTTTVVKTKILNSIAANQWYEVQLHINPLDSSYSVTILQGDAIVAQQLGMPIDFSQQPVGLYFASDGRLAAGGAGTDSVYVDNVVLSTVPDLNLGFEVDPAGSAPTAWTTYVQKFIDGSPFPGSSVLVTNLESAEGGKSLEMAAPADSSNGSCIATMIGKNGFVPASGVEQCSFKIKFTNASYMNFRIRLLNENKKVVGNTQISFSSGMVYAYYGVPTQVRTSVCSFVAGQWYTVKLVHTPGIDAYDLYIYDGSGALLASRIGLASAFSTAVEGLRFDFDGWTVAGMIAVQSAYLDGITLSGPIHAPRTLYISPSGSDTNTGTPSDPFKTLLRATSVVHPNDTIIAKDGSYSETSYTYVLPTFGYATAARPVMIKSENKHGAVITFQNLAGNKLNIQQNHTTLQDFEVTQNEWHSSLASGEPNTSDTLVISSKNAHSLVTGNKIHGAFEECVKSGDTDFFRVTNNLLYDTGHEGIDGVFVNGMIASGNEVTNVGRCGILAKAGSKNVQIFNNYVHSGTTDMVLGAIYLGGQSLAGPRYDTSTSGYENFNSVAYNNVVVSESGLINNGLCITGGKDCTLVNNVVVGAKYGIYVDKVADIALGWAWDPMVRNAVIKNNIIQDCTTALRQPAGVTEGTYVNDYNIYFNSGTPPSQPHGSTSDPLFVDKWSDWHLQTGSPALDGGSATTAIGYSGEVFDLSRDQSGTLRNNPPDMGIYEQ